MMEYRELKTNQISPELFEPFNRYQKVTKCWRKENGAWMLEDISFEEDWSADDRAFLVQCLKNTTTTGGAVFGAFKDDSLVGFSSLENEHLGANQEYLQLSSLHVSNEQRGGGIGKTLFKMSADRARAMGAEKLYISAHSSQETQAFYKSMGCFEAVEYIQKLSEKEPSDCQLEYLL